mgnify:FL=1
MQRNFSIDILKSIAALLVICIHTGYPSVFKDYIIAFCRIAVPLFLLISGYYYQLVIDRKKVLSYYKKILALTFFSSVFYFVADGVELGYLRTFRWDKMLMFSFPVAGDHLWYLFSLINVLVILALCYRIKNKLYYLTPFLLLGNYALSFFPKFWFYRNFLFTSLPYFLLGMYIYKYNESIFALVKKKTLVYIFIIGLILQCFEVFLYKYWGLIYVRDHYLMTFLLSIMLFSYALVVKIQKENVLSVIGKKYSAYIYIFHIFILSHYTFIMGFFGINCNYFSYIKPLIAFVFTLFMSFIVLKLYNLLKRCYVNIKNLYVSA